MGMTRADKLRQSIECVAVALSELCQSAEPYATGTPGEAQMRITINPEDDGGPWREACDMLAQAREEAKGYADALTWISNLATDAQLDAKVPALGGRTGRSLFS